MEPKVKQLTAKETRHWAVQVVLGVTFLVSAYLAASWAIDRGSLLAYVLTLVLLVAGVRELVLSVRDTWRRRRT